MKTELSAEQIKSKMDSLSKILEEAKTNKATFTGRLQEATKRLKEDLKIASVEEALKEAASLETECQKLKNEIQRKFQKLQESYEW